MPAVDFVVLGQSAAFEALFFNEDGVTPFVTTSAVLWVVRDFNGALVVSGTAAQDSGNPERWTATVVIPTSAPVSDIGKRYSIHWVARGASERLRHTDQFQVKAAIDFDYIELDRLAPEKSRLVDSIAIDPNEAITSATIRVLTEMGDEVYSSGSVTPGAGGLSAAIATDSRNVYTFMSADVIEAMTVDRASFKPFIIEWLFDVGGIQEREYHFLYVVNPSTLVKVHELRRFIDKARSQNPNKVLQYTDVDLVAHLDIGMQTLNFLKPTLTNWTINAIPVALFPGLLHCAAYSILSAQYLAEGQAAFDFSGQSVSLTVDRTQYIDAALGRIIAFMENQIPTAKRMWLRSTGGNGQAAGILGVNIGPSLGWAAQGWRDDRYRRFIAGI